jgi:hypothetical protein
MRDDEKTTSTNWRREAKSVRPKAIWIQGDGEYASISDCPRGPTIILHKTREQADRAKDLSIASAAVENASVRRVTVLFI